MISNDSSDKKVKVELVKLLYKQLIYGLCAETLAAVTLAAALWMSNFNLQITIIWLLFNLIFCGFFRYILYFSFKRETARKELNYKGLKFWVSLFTLGVIFSGLSWGVTGYLFMPQGDFVFRSFNMFLLIGVVAAANPLYSLVKNMYVPFLILTCFPFTYWLFTQDHLLILLGLLSIIFMFIMYVFSNNNYKVLYKALLLKIKNDELVESLSFAKNQMELHASRLEKAFALEKATLESTHDGILTLGLNNKIENFNKKFLEMWHIPDSILESKNSIDLFELMISQLESEESINKLLRALMHTHEERGIKELKFKDDRIFECNFHPLYVGDKCEGKVLSFRDITTRKFLENKLFHQANYDILTGLPNRALALDRLTQGMIHSKKTNNMIAMFFIDVDRFKIINDTLGHTIGDELLIQIAKRLVKCIRETDTVSRKGGDEFLAIIDELENEEHAFTVARKMLGEMRNPFFIDGNKLNATISIGVSFYPKDGSEPEILIRNADIAMYHAKEYGRNNVQTFTEEMNKKTINRMIMENHLREAIYLNELSLMYQPILSLKTGKIVALEALLRWNHFKFGNISIGEIIALAEESGLIFQMGEWVFYTACKQLNQWHQMNLPQIQVAINFSSRQFKQANFFENMKKIIDDTQVNPNYLLFEITETIIMDNIENAIATLNKIKQLGISVVIDDFGTGYSSLNYLKRFPVDQVKIDRSFIKELPYNNEDAAITTAILALASCLNIAVIAEGVETVEQLKFLINRKCDECQGEIFSKPLDVDTCTSFLLEGRSLNLEEIMFK